MRSNVAMLILASSLVLVIAQPPLPPPGVSPQCNASLTEMNTKMLQSWGQWAAHTTADCLTKCIPSDRRISPKPGKICQAQCCDNTSPWEADYSSACTHQGGATLFKDIDLVWGSQYACKGILGKVKPCFITTSMIACMPAACTANDIALVGAMETKDFCPTVAQYNLTSCAVNFVVPPSPTPKTKVLASAATTAPVSPTNWKATTSASLSGTVPGIKPGTTNYDLYYDYAAKMLRESYTSGPHAGRQVVYRYDKKVPGEKWSRAYQWTVGKEATCCYIDLCNGGPPCSSGVDSMNRIGVDNKATDIGPSGGGEHWQHDTHIGTFTSDTNDWIVDTSNQNSIIRWTSNATIKGLWAASDSVYSSVSVGNCSASDFDYPRTCDNHEMCNGNA